MTTTSSWIRSLSAALGVAVLMAGPLAAAQDRHNGHAPRYSPPKYSAHHGHSPSRHAAPRPSRDKHHAAPSREYRHTPVAKHHSPSHSSYRPLPKDYRYVRHDIKPFGHAIRRGPALPSHYKIVRGHHLPPGYGRVVAVDHYHYLPRYAGYEWRSVGSDLVLVAAATGIVYAIVDNILN
jgi:Ni/Co efflux regulator RcnB